jgi:GAF domain-containing protein
MRAYLMIPLISQDEFVGVLALASETPGSFYPQHIETVRELADHLAVTLQYPRLFEQLTAAPQNWKH